MANPEHLEILNRSVKEWNQWRTNNPEVKPDLSAADLNRVNLSAANLSAANLSETNLRGANLSYASLSGADLYKAELYKADLSETNLKGATLSGADLSWANLRGAYLSGADIGAAHIGYTTLGNVDLSKAKGLETVEHVGPSTIGIDTIYKSQGKIPEVFLRGCGVPDNLISYIGSLIGKPWEFYSCFISYSSRNQDFAERIYADLQSNGVRCWYAPEDLKIGEKFRIKIDQSIRIYDKLLLVLSEHSVRSQWVEKEVETAMEREREQGRDATVLFPIKLDDAIETEKSGWAADISRSRHIGDFRKWETNYEYQKAFKRLLRDLRAEQ